MRGDAHDNDCTAATAGSIAGACLGTAALDGKWYAPFGGRIRSYFNGRGNMKSRTSSSGTKKSRWPVPARAHKRDGLFISCYTDKTVSRQGRKRAFVPDRNDLERMTDGMKSPHCFVSLLLCASLLLSAFSGTALATESASVFEFEYAFEDYWYDDEIPAALVGDFPVRARC